LGNIKNEKGDIQKLPVQGGQLSIAIGNAEPPSLKRGADLEANLQAPRGARGGGSNAENGDP